MKRELLIQLRDELQRYQEAAENMDSETYDESVCNIAELASIVVDELLTD